MTDTNWRSRAACRTFDPELFFPLPGMGHQAAAAVCAHCPVRAACLDDALRAGDIHGYRGGVTGDQRADMVRARRSRPAPKPTPVERVLALSASGCTPREISVVLDVHVDSVRRVLRRAREAAA